MYSVEFKYALHRRRDHPLIPVGLRTGGKWRQVWTYVDSGSFYTIFDDKVAEILVPYFQVFCHKKQESCQLSVKACWY